MNNADVNAKDEHGDIALHRGSEIDVEFVKILIRAGANINAQNNKGETSLLKAAWILNTPSVKYLLEKGADPNLGDPTPLHAAA
jgi:ankyrin repeat protein